MLLTLGDDIVLPGRFKYTLEALEETGEPTKMTFRCMKRYLKAAVATTSTGSASVDLSWL